MKELSIPLLTEQDIDCRVQSVSKAKTGRTGATSHTERHERAEGPGWTIYQPTAKNRTTTAKQRPDRRRRVSRVRRPYQRS